jgi:hypothetical protein
MPPQGCCHGIVPKKAHAEQAFDDAIVKVNAPWDSALLCSPHAYLAALLATAFLCLFLELARSYSHTLISCDCHHCHYHYFFQHHDN